MGDGLCDGTAEPPSSATETLLVIFGSVDNIVQSQTPYLCSRSCARATGKGLGPCFFMISNLLPLAAMLLLYSNSKVAPWPVQDSW